MKLFKIFENSDLYFISEVSWKSMLGEIIQYYALEEKFDKIVLEHNIEMTHYYFHKKEDAEIIVNFLDEHINNKLRLVKNKIFYLSVINNKILYEDFESICEILGCKEDKFRESVKEYGGKIRNEKIVFTNENQLDKFTDGFVNAMLLLHKL